MKIYIDGIEADIDNDPGIEISISKSRFTEIEDAEDATYRIKLPATQINRTITANCEQILSPEMFNRREHMIIIEEDGVALISGKVRLRGSETEENGREWYMMDIIAPVAQWISSASKHLLRESGIEFGGTIDGGMVSGSWNSTSPVKFFPVQRDRYNIPEYWTEVAPVRTLTYEDYHPFVNIKALVETIVQASGYSIESQFMNTEFFRSLYMSGYYPAKNIDLIKSRMNFFAGKFSDSHTAANSFGVVFTDTSTSAASVGNIVDTADPYVYDQGKRIEGAFNYGGAFKMVNGRAAFVPQDNVTAGFEYRLIYKSDWEPVSETQMKGFDTITLDDGIQRKVSSANMIEDRKQRSSPPGEYVVFIFDYDPAATYRLVVKNSDLTETSTTITGKKSVITIAKEGTPHLYISSAEKNGGWAIYRSVDYREATQGVVTDVTLRSTPVSRPRNTPCYLDYVTFRGAVAGAAFTLCADTSVRPFFYVNPMEGSEVTFNEIFAHEQKQIKLFSALKHLFDLDIFTDTISKKIYIEPHGSFTGNRVVDWQAKLDTGRPIVVEEPGGGRARRTALLYTDDDGTVMRWNEANKKKYAQWLGTVEGMLAKDETLNSVNPLFAPSINENNCFPQAWGSLWLKAGDRSKKGDNYDDCDLNFAPKIVRFTGMKQLAAGESWGYPTYGREYPLIAFHYPAAAEGFTLCFDDFEGQPGLHRYHDLRFRELNEKKRITAYINLGPDDMANILYPGNMGRDMRSVFRLKIGGETIDCRLEEVVDYRIDGGKSTKCVFIKL